MNERIKEMSKQAHLVADATYAEGPDEIWLKEYNKKFAELIVRECIQVSEAHAKDLESQPTDPLLEMYDNGIVNGIYEATEAIKEHFGVEQ